MNNLIQELKLNVEIRLAIIEDYPTIQNMARFYVYDRTAYMGWECPEDGLFECIDFKHYFENPDEKAYLIRVDGEIAGFVLLDKMQLFEPVDWNMGEFFILAKFQGKNVASEVACQIFNDYPGRWSVAVMPENVKAARFWHRIVGHVSCNNFNLVSKTADELKTTDNLDPYPMNIYTFNTNTRSSV